MTKQLYFRDYRLREGDTFYISDDSLPPLTLRSVHTHDFWEFFLVTKGPVIQILNGERMELAEKELQILAPWDAHTLGAAPGGSRICNIAVDAAGFERMLARLGREADAVRGRFRPDPYLYQELTGLTGLAKKRVDDEAAFHFVLECALETVLIHACFAKEDTKKLPLWLDSLLTEMQKPENYIAGPRRMLELSHKTQGHLSRSVKKHLGVTVTGYVNSLRLEHAASLLRSTDKKIVDIALESGFESVPYFNRIFKERYLVTPHRWRKKSIL